MFWSVCSPVLRRCDVVMIYEAVWTDNLNYIDPVLLHLSPFGTPRRFTIVQLYTHKN